MQRKKVDRVGFERSCYLSIAVPFRYKVQRAAKLAEVVLGSTPTRSIFINLVKYGMN
jgi:hypothetical protein